MCCVFCLHVCLYVMCMPSTFRGQKRVSGLLELELQMVMNCYVGENQTWVAGKAASVPNCWAISPVPELTLFKLNYLLKEVESHSLLLLLILVALTHTSKECWSYWSWKGVFLGNKTWSNTSNAFWLLYITLLIFSFDCLSHKQMITIIDLIDSY